jgi:cell division septum initiation protein DivIVA
VADIIVHGADAAEGAASATVAEIAHDVGAVEAKAENTADDVAEHAEKITNVEQDAEWTKQRIAYLETELLARPTAEAHQALTTELRQLQDTVSSLVRDGSTSQAESGNSTDEPEAAPNHAKEKPKGFFGGIRAALHRLL